MKILCSIIILFSCHDITRIFDSKVARRKGATGPEPITFVSGIENLEAELIVCTPFVQLSEIPIKAAYAPSTAASIITLEIYASVCTT